jgi:periplasmic mercuric ion binding protein
VVRAIPILKVTIMRLRTVVIALLLTASAFAENIQTAVLKLQNMTCPTCKITVRKALEKVAGVKEINVDFDKRIATVRFDADKTNTANLTKATTDAGFPATVGK